MIKKFTIWLLVSFIVFLALGSFAVFKFTQQKKLERLQKQLAKAPEDTITIIEGWTTDDIAGYLQKKGLTDAKSFISAQKDFRADKYPFLGSKPSGASLEGFLFPDTYRVPKNSGSSKESNVAESSLIIKKMLENFSQKFTEEMQGQAGKRHMSVYEILTLASIIERETGRNAATLEAKQQLADERKIIAGIFYNRLNTGQPLQSDATINYITKKNTPTASADDLQIDSPYNTYKYKGLPPGPICNPSLSSIQAALEPASTDYFYFLHKQPSGEPVYSKTFEEHVKNKNKYLK